MREIVLIGPLPPPYVGQSISFQMLVDGMKEDHIPYTVVDLSGKRKSYGGAASWARALEYIKILFDYFRKSILGKKTIYVTIAQSRHGFFRDFVIIWFAYLKGHRIVCHLKGGNYDNFYEAQQKCMRWIIRRTLLRVDNIIDRKESYILPVEDADGTETRLTVIEWKFKLDNKNLHLCNESGFCRHEMAAGVNAPGIDYTAYLSSPVIEKYHIEAQLVFEDMHEELKALIGLAKEKIREHFTFLK